MTAIPQGPASPQGPGQPPQGPTPPQGIVPPRVPEQQQDVQAVTIGPDSPPAMGQIGNPQGAAAPPAWDGWLPPPQLPSNFSEQQMVIDRMRQEFNFVLQRREHQADLAIQQGIQQAPGKADQLMRDIRMKPGDDFSAQIDELEANLPPSKAKHLRTSHDRIRKLKGSFSDYEKEVEETLRTQFPKDVFQKGDDVEGLKQQAQADKAWRGQVDIAMKEMWGAQQSGDAKRRSAAEARLQELQENRPKVDKAATADIGMSDVGRGLASIVTGDESVEDAMLRSLADLRKKHVADDVDPAFRAIDRFGQELTHPGSYMPGGRSRIEGVSRTTLRAALTDVARRKVHELKKDTEDADLVGNVAGAVPWIATGIGEIALSAKAVQGAVRAMPWLARGGKFGSLGGKLMTYAGGPAMMEFGYGMVRDLPGTRQAEIDSIEDPKLKEATDTAFRFQQATLDATMAVAFSFGDIAHASKSLKGMEHIANNPGKAMTDALKLGLIAPGAAEGANVLIGEGAKAMAANQGEAADVLRDLYAAKGMYGPIQQFMDAKTPGERLAAAKAYGKQMLPMMAGVGAAHAMTGFGVKFASRKDMLEMRRDVHEDIAKQDASDQAKAQMRRVMDEELESLTPSHREDARRRNLGTITERHAEAASSVVAAEKLAGELLGGVPGKTLDEKLSHLEPDTPEGRVGDLLKVLRRTKDASEAEQIIAEIRQLDEVEPGPIDESVEAARVQDNVARLEDPGVDDEAIARAAEAAETEWAPVGRDEDAGTVTLRKDNDGDAPTRLTVPEDEVGSYNVAEPPSHPEPPSQDRGGPDPQTKVVGPDGKPIRVFHGSSQHGGKIDPYIGEYGLFGQGAYFTEDPSIAGEYATTKGLKKRGQQAGSTHPAYLSIKNPIDMDAPVSPLWAKVAEEHGIDLSELKTNEQVWRAVEQSLADDFTMMSEASEQMQQMLLDMGFDGITHIGGGRVAASKGTKHRVWIAFDPEQIHQGVFAPEPKPEAKSADPVWSKDVPELAGLQDGSTTPQKFVNAVAKRLDAEGAAAWQHIHNEYPELRGKSRKNNPPPSKKKIKQQLLRQAKDIAEQAGHYKRPDAPNNKRAQTGESMLTWLAKAGGLSEAEWRKSGVDFEQLRGHKLEKQLVSPNSKNKWGDLASAMNESGWMGRDAESIGGMNADFEIRFPEMVQDALGENKIINWEEGGMSGEAMEAMEASMGGGRAPAPEQPKIIGDATEKAIEAIKGGATSGRALADATGLSRARAGKVLKQMFDEGMLVKKGNGYELAPNAGEGMTPEAVARRDEADQITQQLLGDAQALAHDLARGGSQVLDDRGARMARDIADYGDLVRPDDPQIASAELASRVLLELAPENRTDELIRQLGMGETDVAVVREFMRQREEPTPPAGQQTSLSPEVVTAVDAALEGRTRLDLAMKGPQLEALSDGVRATFEEMRAMGATEEEAAAHAWNTWHDEANGEYPPHSFDDEITRQSQHMASLNRDIVTLNTEKHAKALGELGELVGAVRENDEWTGMLSMHPGGREYLKQLNALWHAATVRREVPVMKGMEVAADRRKRLAKKLADERRAGERGALNVGVVIVGAADAAAAILRASVRTVAKVWGATWRAITKGINLLKQPGIKLMDIIRHSTHEERVANRIEIRASTVDSLNVGKRRKVPLIDNLTKWGETDLITTYEKAAFNAKIAHEAASRLNTVLKEDSSFDLSLNRALEILGIAKADRTPGDDAWLNNFQDNLTPEQADVVGAMRQMYGQLRDLVAGELLPTQQQRRRDMALVEQLVEESRQLTETMSAAWDQAMEVGDRATQRKAKTAHDKAVKKQEAAEARLKRLQDEAVREREQWGITERGFAPAVPNKDPSEALARAVSEGRLSEEEIRMGDVQEALRDLATTSAKMREKAHDFMHSPIPAAPRAGHWMSRKGTLEAAGAREQSALRSFFHYVKEVYRLIPAAQWHERNYDRLWGREKWVSADELDAGSLNGGGHVVEYVADQVPATARKRTHYRLGGKAYGITLINPTTKKSRKMWFRSTEDAKAALKADHGEWQPAAKQNLSKHYMLMHHEARPGAEVDVSLPGIDRTTKQLLVSNHDVKYVLPTNAVGSYVKKVGGKYAAIRKMEGGGKKQANEFAAYIDQGLQRIMGRELLTAAERMGASFSAGVRHKLLGMLQPSSAIKEAMDNFVAYAIHGGVEGAADATHYALEFSTRMRAANAKLEKLSAGDWMLQHTPDASGDILPKALVDGVRTPKKKLDAMSPEQREVAMMEDDAYVAFLHSALSGDSISEHIGVVKRQDGYGQKLFLSSGAQTPGFKGQVKHGREIGSRLMHATGDASWFLRRRAQGYGMRMTWIGAYMTQRKAGKTDAEATKVATRFALAQGNIGNRLSQAEFFQSAIGRVIKPLASWSLATSATNFRQLFQHSGNLGRKLSMVGKRMAYFAAMIYGIEQLGLLADLDMGNSTGGKLSQVPLVGPMAAYSAQELLSKMELAADPADASRTLPEWRQKAMAQAREHAPDFLREYLVRRGADLGGFPADVPIPMLAGTWSPYVADAAADFFKVLTTSDDKKRAQSLHNLVGANFDWMRAWNRLYQTAPDPSDPNYLLIKNPTTGHMQQRVKKGDEGAAIWNLLMPDIETSVRRIERSVLQPRRDELRASTTRNAAFQAQKNLIEADRIRDSIREMKSPEQQQVAQARIDKLNQGFRDQVKAYAKERGLGVRDMAATAVRWRKVAKANLSLTSRERDVINAYDADTAFRMWSAAMNDVGDPMTRVRFQKVKSLRYSSTKAMFVSLAKQSKETRDLFMKTYKTSRARWSEKKR